MRRRGPNKSILDRWLDQFADFSVEDQAGALKFAEVIHRQLKRLLQEGREDAEIETTTLKDSLAMFGADGGAE